MARTRSLKPGFFQNEELADAGPYAMLLFAGLWTIADREGRLEDRPRRIKAQLLPYFDLDTNAELDRLAEAGFVLRYEHGGTRYIQIQNFAKHQSPHVNEAESVIPAPCDVDTSTVLIPEPHQSSTVQEPEHIESGMVLVSLNTSSQITDYSENDISCARDFDARFWARYPKGRGVKKQALAQWRRLKPEDRDAAATGLDRWLACEQWQDPRYVVHAERWLRDRRWEDEPPPSAARSPAKHAQPGFDHRGQPSVSRLLELAQAARQQGASA